MALDWEALQEFAKAEMRKVYSDTTIDHAMDPRNMGDMDDADGFARLTGPCGDTLEIQIRVNNDIITDIAFLTDGCGSSIAAGSMVTELAKGKSITDAQKISRQDILDALGGLPEENEHCALLAARTLNKAIRDYLAVKKDGWKKAYRQH